MLLLQIYYIVLIPLFNHLLTLDTMQIDNATVKAILKSVITTIKHSTPNSAANLGIKYLSEPLSDNLFNNNIANTIVTYTHAVIRSSTVQAAYTTASTEYIRPTINVSTLLFSYSTPIISIVIISTDSNAVVVMK